MENAVVMYSKTSKVVQQSSSEFRLGAGKHPGSVAVNQFFSSPSLSLYSRSCMYVCKQNRRALRPQTAAGLAGGTKAESLTGEHSTNWMCAVVTWNRPAQE